MFINIKKSASEMRSFFITWIKSFSAGLVVLCILTLGFLPFISPITSYTHVFLTAIVYSMIFSIFAASWDFLAGVAGQFNFGQVIFLGIGSYAGAYFVKYLQLPPIAAVFIGGAYGIVAGLILGLAVLRLKGPYLAVATLGFSVILFTLFTINSLSPIFWGQAGITGLTNITTLDYTLGSTRILEYFIIFIFMLVCLIFLASIKQTKFGTILKSIRDDETGADASGINTNKYKIYAFMISAFFAGIAGSLLVFKESSASPNNFGALFNFLPIIMASLGGIGTISGAAIGAFFFYILEYVIIQVNTGLSIFGIEIVYLDVYLIFAGVLIVVIRFSKRGVLRPLIENLKKLYDLLRGR